MKLTARLSAPLLAVALAGGFAGQLALTSASAADLAVTAAPLQTWVVAVHVSPPPVTFETAGGKPAEPACAADHACAHPDEGEKQTVTAGPTVTGEASADTGPAAVARPASASAAAPSDGGSTQQTATNPADAADLTPPATAEASPSADYPTPP